MAELLGTFEQAVLLTIVRLEPHAYGRAVLNEVERVLGRGVSAGSVYATLDRLATSGMVSSRTEEGTPARGGRARRYFAIAAEGERALSETRAALTAMWKNVRLPEKVHS
jgi:DNA-binding PadR family transcriptional regulator